MPKWLRQELPDIKKSTAAAWIYRRYDISLRDFLKITLSGIGLLLITADIFYHNLLAAAVLCPYLHFRLKIKSEELHKQRRERLKMQFKDGMQSVAFSLNSGYSIENAWKEAIVEMRLLYGENSEIVTEFQRIINRLERNENIEDVLEEFAKKSGVADIEYFAAVFRYAKRYGGDLIAIIRHTAETIREKNETYHEIQTIISGKKMEQKVMSAVPFFLLGYMKLTAWDFICPLYGNPAGVLMMSISLMVYIGADYIAGKIVEDRSKIRKVRLYAVCGSAGGDTLYCGFKDRRKRAVADTDNCTAGLYRQCRQYRTGGACRRRGKAFFGGTGGITQTV